MNTYDHLESEQMRIDEKRHFIFGNIKCLCDHGCLYQMKAIKGKYIPGNVHNQMEEIFIKYWNEKKLFGLYSRKHIPDLTNHDRSESNMKCEICKKQL